MSCQLHTICVAGGPHDAAFIIPSCVEVPIASLELGSQDTTALGGYLDDFPRDFAPWPEISGPGETSEPVSLCPRR